MAAEIRVDTIKGRSGINTFSFKGDGFSFDWHGSMISKTVQNPDILSLLNSLSPKSLWILAKMLKSAL